MIELWEFSIFVVSESFSTSPDSIKVDRVKSRPPLPQKTATTLPVVPAQVVTAVSAADLSHWQSLVIGHISTVA